MAKRDFTTKRKYYRLNHNIQAQQVRVVDEEGKQIGVLSTGEALRLAQAKEVDLVEVAPKANPPVCKIIDFKKFRYLEAKKTQSEKKKSKKVGLKEIRLTPFMAEGDLQHRIKRTKEFLKEGNRIRLTVLFKGRQLGKKDFGYQILKQAIEKLSPFAQPEGEPRFIGRRLEIALVPTKGRKSGQKDKTEN